MTNLTRLIGDVERWAAERGIFAHSTPAVQLLKTVSELGELADATNKHDRDGIIDGVGDVLVTLVIYSRLQGVTLEECLDAAYETIKDRKGRLTAEGVFVKEEA
jgi:NTP pyrophosphatase (non-canonical NTP hydrolase)